MLRNPDTETSTATPAADSLVSLLGDQRAALVTFLHRNGEQRLAALAEHLGVSEVATRRHLGVLEDDGLLTAREVADGPGRPARHYRLTDRALRLFPDRTAHLAEELLEFLATSQGDEGLRAYLRWRLERQARELEDAVTADELGDRLEQLAEALSEAGFAATVDVAGDRFVLRQDHCAIEDVARNHPEMCAFEAAAFREVLGADVRVSRQQTRADGATTCVCCVTPRDLHAPSAARRLPLVDSPATPDADPDPA